MVQLLSPSATPLQQQPAMNRSKTHRDRLAADLQSAHQERASALIERRIMLAELEALQLRIQEIEEYVDSLKRALDGPVHSARPASAHRR